MTILLFGITKDIVGSSSLSIADSETAQLQTVGDLKAHLCSAYPQLNNLSSLAVAVNNNYADENDPIKNIDEIALIPPVSGG